MDGQISMVIQKALIRIWVIKKIRTEQSIFRSIYVYTYMHAITHFRELPRPAVDKRSRGVLKRIFEILEKPGLNL